MMGRIFVVAFLLYLGTHFVGVKAQLNICPVQGLNRTIQPGYPLIQCFPFYLDGACCQRHEEQAVFNMFDELRFTASDSCVSTMQNLLCYICSPTQANWYIDNEPVVCGSFCDLLWARCAPSARFGNTMLSSLYSSGREFCRREGFVVQGTTNSNCYNVHRSLASTGGSGAATIKISGMFIVSFATLVISILMFL